MARLCGICDRKIGLKPSINFVGGSACENCLNPLGVFVTQLAFEQLLALAEMSLDDVKAAIAGDPSKQEKINLHSESKDGIERKAKENQKIQTFMNKYQLEDLDEKDLIVLKRIAGDLAGKGLFEMASFLGNQEAREKIKITHLSALVEQNWMIIRQLSRLNKGIEQLLQDKGQSEA